MITFDDVSFRYEQKTTIDHVSFHIEKGEFAAIIGANGAGKTTMTKLMNGIFKPCEGNVQIGGKNTRKTKTSELAGSIGFLFQNPDRQICRNTIREEILFGLKNILSDAEEMERRCDEVLKTFGFYGTDNPFSMSRGERQRIALASVLALKPEILVLDEPTTGLDYRECMHIMEAISEMNKQGATVVMVTHDMEIVQDFARRVLVMGGGRLLADGDKSTVFRNDGLIKAASIRPPQITELALRLGNDFTEAQTADEMVRILLKRRSCVI